MSKKNFHPCPCCGYLTLEKKPPGTYLICPICFWEDAINDDCDPRSWNSNRVTLRQAQRNFLAFGACEKNWMNDVRQPTHNDKRSPDWQTLDAFGNAAALKAIDQITKAFDGVSRQDGISLHEAIVIDNYGSDIERAKARQKDRESRWQDIPDEWIAKFDSILCFLDPKGWRYYIPAYMIWSLKHYTNSHSNTLNSTIYTFIWSGFLDDYYLPRFAILNLEQSKAVHQFLQFMATHAEDYADTDSAKEAIEKYWRKFA